MVLFSLSPRGRGFVFRRVSCVEQVTSLSNKSGKVKPKEECIFESLNAIQLQLEVNNSL